MSGADHRDDARMNQENLSFILSIFEALLDRFFPPPPLRPDELYTRKEVMRRARTSGDTFAAWVAAGLPVTKPGCDNELIWGGDLIPFLRDNKDLKVTRRKPKPKK